VTEALVITVVVVLQSVFAVRLAQRYWLPRLRTLKGRANALTLLAAALVIAGTSEFTRLTGSNPFDGTNCHAVGPFCEIFNDAASVTMVVALAMLPLAYLYSWTVGSELDENFDWQTRTQI
jgi:hypothetical protein